MNARRKGSEELIFRISVLNDTDIYEVLMLLLVTVSYVIYMTYFHLDSIEL